MSVPVVMLSLMPISVTDLQAYLSDIETDQISWSIITATQILSAVQRRYMVCMAICHADQTLLTTLSVLCQHDVKRM